MTVFGSIVQAFMLPMLHARHDNPLCGGVARQLIGDHHTRSDALLLEQLAQQALGRLRVAPALDQNVEYDSMLVHGAPEPMFSARDADYHLVDRVQSLLDAKEICLTGEVLSAPGVKDILAPFAMEQEVAQLKGVQQHIPVFRIRSANSPAV
jgi:hypothetical protein